MEFNEYERIIVKDVGRKNYKRDTKVLIAVFIFTTALFALIYIFGFHSEILKNLKSILLAYRESLLGFDQEYRLLVYNFNKIIAFLIFLSLFFVFLLFCFFAYDIISRNKVIGFYQKRVSELESHNTSKGNDK